MIIVSNMFLTETKIMNSENILSFQRQVRCGPIVTE